MERFIEVTSKRLALLGYLGFLGFVFSPFLFLLFGFWLFGFAGAFRGHELRILAQSLCQIWGMLYTPVIHGFRLPSKENYACKESYILPFTGKWTVVNGGVDQELSHSWGSYPQRYAYDFIILDDEGNYSEGDKSSLQSYFCYGKDIVAPADGEVVKVRNHHKDSRTDGENVYCDAADIAGNHVIIKHNKNEYSAIGHIMPNSITVNIGDFVKQGQIIAKCGNSGNTSQPHIHFQLQNGKNFFTSAGLPIMFDGINAWQKMNYGLLDKRACQGNLRYLDGGKVYILLFLFVRY